MMIEDLIHPLRRRSLAAGECLFRQGDPATAIYRVEAGRLRLVRHLADGTAVTVHTAGAGETFAEAALFADAYHCDAVAETAAAVVPIPKALVLRHLSADAAAALDFSAYLARQVRDLRWRLELRNIRGGSERLLTWLKAAAVGTPPRVEPGRPWKAVAAEIGLTHEALYRALAALERRAAIRRDKAGVTLLV